MKKLQSAKKLNNKPFFRIRRFHEDGSVSTLDISSRKFRCESKNSEKGSVLAEMTLVAPFLAALTFAIVDIGMSLLNYMMLQQAAREGVRAAGRMVEFNGAGDSMHESDDNAATLCDMLACGIPNGNCGGGPVSVVGECAHVPVQARVREIITMQRLISMEGHAVSVRSTFIDDDLNPGTTAPEEDTVVIQLEGEYNGFVFSPTLRTSYEGPYMFQRS